MTSEHSAWRCLPITVGNGIPPPPASSNTCELFKYPVCTQPYSAVTDAIRWANLGAEPTLMKCMVSRDLKDCDQHCSSTAGSGWSKPC